MVKSKRDVLITSQATAKALAMKAEAEANAKKIEGELQFKDKIETLSNKTENNPKHWGQHWVQA